MCRSAYHAPRLPRNFAFGNRDFKVDNARRGLRLAGQRARANLIQRPAAERHVQPEAVVQTLEENKLTMEFLAVQRR
jgi:hypothetical protein